MATESPRDRMVLAALDLLRQGGWWTAGINPVIEASGAPKGSLYHYFPEGKNSLLAAALDLARTQSGEALRTLFSGPKPLAARIQAMFKGAARFLEGNGFTRGCPVAATTLDLGAEAQSLQPVCAAVFAHWVEAIAEGLREFPPERRAAVAQWILGTYEGAMVMARAQANGRPLVEAGEFLAHACDALAAGSPATAPQGQG